MSKGLELYYKDTDGMEVYSVNGGIHKSIKDIEKELKALEIIKKRLIDMQDIVLYKTFSSFNQRRTLRGLLPIPKEEYDLLKRCCYETAKDKRSRKYER